ncbi:MAG: DNA polymerase/3'-5' exonuclease PolX [Verrucomicrobiota bacterium]
MDNQQVAQVLTGIGTYLELKGENPFKTRAYQNAARIIETLHEPIANVAAEDRLREIDGIGEAIALKIAELVRTGRLEYFEKLKESVPAGLLEMLEIPGLGPKKITVLHQQLGVDSVEKLERACKDGSVAALDRFGEKTQARILEGIERRRSYATRHLLSEAWLVGQELLDSLRLHPDVLRCSTAGSLRRCREVIGDVDLLASSQRPNEVLEYFVTLPEVKSVLARGDTKASVVLKDGLQADLRVVSDTEFASALMYFTGSKDHNIVMRQRAIERGLRLNEYGLFRSAEETRDPKLRIECRTEEDIFRELGLNEIPAELRENSGEFDLAEKEPLPRLVEWSDLRGSLHNHSTWSDGRQAPEQIARAMSELGLSYWAVTDHSRSSVQANGLTPERVRQQIREVAAINRRLADEGLVFRLLTGCEVDILAGGKLDFPDDLLAELDVVVASIHRRLAETEAETTRRLIRAAENPNVHMLGHLTGRLLLEREPYPVDIPAVIEACAATGTWIELNATPERLDMDWRWWPRAAERGVKCVINCDAHRFEHAGYLRLGAGIARKGRLQKSDVINTLPLEKLNPALQSKRCR